MHFVHLGRDLAARTSYASEEKVGSILLASGQSATPATNRPRLRAVVVRQFVALFGEPARSKLEMS
jgi:hypothetical protein